MKQYFFILPLILLMVSCKKETPIDELPLVVYEEPENEVELILSVLVAKDDNFDLFYTQDSTENYSGEQMLRTFVSGSNKVQDVQFVLPNAARPTNMRLDFGDNTEQEVMELKQLRYKYHNDSLVIKASEFFKYFRFNQDLVTDNTDATLKPVIATDREYDPLCMSNSEFTSILLQLYNNKSD